MTNTTVHRFDAENVYLIAEIGGNHEGSFELAQKQLELAIASGADCIKFQLYRGETLVNGNLSPDRQQHFRKFELKSEQHIALATRCLEAGRDYLASVWDLDMLPWIDPFLKHYKIGSGDLTAVPLLRAFAKKGKPIILSTGLSTFAEIEAAVEIIRKQNPAYREAGMLAVLQCTSMYPIADDDANLRVMGSLAGISNVTVGYSDHTIGRNALVCAVAAGARILEFHFTDQREGKTFRDHKVSLTWDEVQLLRHEIQQVMTFMGSNEKRPLKIEQENGHVTSFRRGLYFAKDMNPGDLVREEDVLCLRPAEGIPAWDYDRLIGAKLKNKVGRLDKLDWSMFE